MDIETLKNLSSLRGFTQLIRDEVNIPPVTAQDRKVKHTVAQVEDNPWQAVKKSSGASYFLCLIAPS